MIPMVDLKRQYMALKADIDRAINDVLLDTRFILGPNVAELEKEVAAYHSLPHAIAVASGTDALLLSLRACGIGPGDEVITTPFTFIATVDVISLLSATPVFVDILPDTFNIDPNMIEKKITKETKAIIPVHLFGHPADMDRICAIAAKYNLRVIEDCAQAFGAEYKGKKVGALGDLGCFSFFPSKNLAGYGDGGMIITDDRDLAENIRLLRNHGSAVRYHHTILGYNSRLDEFQAAIIRVKLKKIEEFNSRRRANAALYRQHITRDDITLPVELPGCRHVYHQFTIRSKKRESIRKALEDGNVSSAIYYPIPLHIQEVFARLNIRTESLEKSEACALEVLSLPMFPELEKEEILHISNVINHAPDTPDKKRVMIVAGEASGDLHGGNLVRAMHKIDPGIDFYGVGGRNLKDAGVEIVADAAKIAVVGLTEVASKLGTILKVMARLKASLKKDRPDLLILIDYPDFNLPLAKAARRYGVKVFYYISPQVWAWRRGRIGKIKNTVDRMAVILPFEEDIYRKAGMDVTFVGHPLLDVVRTKYSRKDAMERFGLIDGVTTVGILPGSRESEVTRLLPVMLGAGGIIENRIRPVQFVLPLADTLDEAFVSQIIARYPMAVRLVHDAVYDVIGCTDVAMVASGTATLETALLETPMVIIYKVSRPSYHVGKAVISVDHIGLVNIIAGKTIVPELIQDEATPEKIAAEVIGTLMTEGRSERIKAELMNIRGMLGSHGAAERVARMAYGMINT